MVVVGDVMVDVVVRSTGAPPPGADAPARVTMSWGGSGANLAVAAAAAGADVHLLAAVGDDLMGKVAADALAAAGVRAHLQVVGAPTGTVVALVNEAGERTMLSDRGANATLRPGPLPAAGHVHVSGYALATPVGRLYLQAARVEGRSCSVDPSPGPVDGFLAGVDGAGWCFANLAEGRTLTGAWEPGDVAAALLPSFSEVLVTLGPRGAVVAGPGGMAEVPAPPAAVVDTTGAGDALAGTFLARRLSGDGPEAAARAGLAAAARAVARPGAGWPRRYSAT